MGLYKTTIVIWTKEDPGDLDLDQLQDLVVAVDAEQYGQKTVEVESEDLRADPDYDEDPFFADYLFKSTDPDLDKSILEDLLEDVIAEQICEECGEPRCQLVRREIFFEHDHWWVRYETEDPDNPVRTFSVVDAAPGRVEGLDVEEV